MHSLSILTPILLLVALDLCVAQERVEPVAAVAPDGITVALDNAETPSNYLLGPDDQITLFVSDLDEISNKPIRIDMRGDLNLPLAGRIHAAGLTVNQLEIQITNRLTKYLEHPDVVAIVSDFRSQPISVLGAVNQPGVHQILGHKMLFEVLSEAGGLRNDAGNTVTITRKLQWGAIPLPGAKNDQTGQFSVASISVKAIMDGSNPAENVVVKPEDVVSVSKSGVVYCVGSVQKPGGFVLGESDSLSALQVLSLAQGLEKTASPEKAKILRNIPGTTQRAEIDVDLKRLMAGKAPDLPLKSEDILFVPNSAAKSASSRTLEAIIQTATGIAIYGRY